MTTTQRGTPLPFVDKPTTFGPPDPSAQWHEYPNGLVDLSRPANGLAESSDGLVLEPGTFEIECEGGRKIRIAGRKAALVVIDMQNFFLSPKIRDHPLGLKAVDPLLAIVPKLRELGVTILWVNWGLTTETVPTLPAAVQRTFQRTQAVPGGDGPDAGFGAYLGPEHGKLLFRGEPNSDLYGPLQAEYEKGKEAGTDVWLHKDRMSGIWGRGTPLEEYLTQHDIKTLFWSGVNADQCVLGSVVDAYSLGYDIVAVEDTIATNSPIGAKENLMYNSIRSYGFVTDAERIVKAISA
ncbi:Isochorismatase hydrolase [Calocera viscosa TUFC12733]|uniref:Isochorismatase hydrolase n=1 Tax=Calocera viscosa (strain TUFC12733) TaxID=1330018 RepID=A0A167RLX1_CALVF|nr:Isochorismatase hydrolase [Calocera viscosa TUFC12733]